MNPEDKFTRKTAVALNYSDKKEAPIVTAKGKGKIAESIIEKAVENQIPVQEDPSLAALLSMLNVSQSIPEELYQAVAEVFAFIYQADKKASETLKNPKE